MKRLVACVVVLACAALTAPVGAQKVPNPVIVVDTAKGVIESELLPKQGHMGVAKILGLADSQLYIMKTAMPGLDGDYSIIGRVVNGITVADRLQHGDVIKNITLKDTAK